MYLAKNSKSPFYQVIFEVNGKLTSKSTRQKLKSEALKFLFEFEKDQKKDSKNKKLLISEFQIEYEKYILETKTKNYLRSVKLSFKHFIEFAGDVYLNDIDVKLVERFIQSTYKRAKYSAGLYYRTLKAGLSTAVRWNYIDNNPFKFVKQPKQVSKYPLFISEIEFQKILEKIKNLDIKKMALISYDAGLRLGEVANLRYSDIDAKLEFIKISNSTDFQTKSKRDRIIPLTNRLHKIILNYPLITKINEGKEEFIFLNKNKVKFNLDYISRSFKKAVREANQNKSYTYHTLRHSFASNLAQAGVSLYIISKLLGHENLRTTQIYAHLQPKNLFEAIEKLNNI